MLGHELPTERRGMLTFFEQHAPAKAVAAVRAAEPLGEVTHYRVPSNRWRRYDKMRRTPAGLLVIGDAICSFNPIYAQGMTVAALEATVLRECLRRGQRDLPRRFFRASAKPIAAAWQTAVGSDLALPEVDAPRPLRVRLSNAFMEHILNAAETDALIADHFMRVVQMIDAPTRLLHPDVLFRIAKSVYALRTTGGYEARKVHSRVGKQPWWRPQSFTRKYSAQKYDRNICPQRAAGVLTLLPGSVGAVPVRRLAGFRHNTDEWHGATAMISSHPETEWNTHGGFEQRN